MSVYVCVKFFPNMEYRDEVLGVFTSENLAHNFAREFPAGSMDDPDTFKVNVLKFNLNKTIWDGCGERYPKNNFVN